MREVEKMSIVAYGYLSGTAAIEVLFPFEQAIFVWKTKLHCRSYKPHQMDDYVFNK